MKISEIRLRNFKSYGNKEQKIKFREKELILLSGRNGSGKSTWKNAIELLLFRKCSGRKNKRLSLTKLPNRINKNLYSYIDFDNQNDDNIRIVTCLSPQKFELFINNEPKHEEFKKYSEKEKDEIIGFSYDMFKSFISLNMNDFRDFVSLNKDDKENLLNKLFGLEKLDKYYSITKTLYDDVVSALDKNNQLHFQYNEKIKDYNNTLLKINNNEKISNDIEILKQKIFKYKPTYLKFENDIREINSKISILNLKFKKADSMKNENVNKRNKLKIEISNLNEKIVSYENGICPICNSDLTDDLSKKEELLLELNDRQTENNNLSDFYNRILTEESGLINKKEEYNKLKYNLIQNFNNLKFEIETLKSQLKYLKEIKRNNTYTHIQKKIDEINLLNNNIKKEIEDLKIRKNSLDFLSNLFKGSKIRGKIINSIIGPVNNNLQKYLQKLNYKYRVKLNNNFDAEIWDRFEKIDIETLSKGESRQINLAIALSYLDIILSKKKSNLMFLDEIFDGIDVENIELILKILKDLINEYNVNIIVVHHGIDINLHYFDRLIKVKYDNIFSDIEDIKLS